MESLSGVKESTQNAWQLCFYCPMQTFKSPPDFVRHLRERHCTREGGSFVCRYGYNGVCASLPLDGVSDRDYESHVTKYHLNAVTKGPEQWSVFSAAQNLPAALNDPSRGKQSNFFTKKWGDSFVEKTTIAPSVHLLPITWDHFESYLNRYSKRNRRHARFVAISLENTNSPANQKLACDVNGSLSDIPPVFLAASIELSNPDIFAAVFPGLSEDQPDHQSGRLLQEKLSYYLDIVEVEIAKQVSKKSSSFFHAMTSQDAIMEQMNEATGNVRTLRSKIQHLNSSIVCEALKIIGMERTRTNSQIILEKLKLMATVHQTQPMIQLLLGSQDYVAALDLISTTQEILAQELIGVHCFRHLPSQLSEMERLIDKMLTTDFERYATADLNRPLTSHDDKVLDEDKLVCIISGLLRQKNFNFIDTYREEAIVTIKAILKQMVIELIASSDAEICLTGAGEEAQSLSLAEWMALLDRATGTLMQLLQRIKSAHDVMRQTAIMSQTQPDTTGTVTTNADFIDTDVFLSASDFGIVTKKLSSMLESICNYCHERCANLGTNQSLERSVASVGEIAALNNTVDVFMRSCEQICGCQSVPLRAALKAQENRFVQKFHAERKAKVALILESERWKQADVPAEFQKMIDLIAKNNFEWPKNEEGTLPSPPSPVLMVDGEPYTLVGSALILVQIISEYCRCATTLPSVAMSLSRNVVDLLRTFNSKCCQLVLGAGALHVAGLKTITSANLVLVSRALQLVVWLFPRIKSHFQQVDPSGAAVQQTFLGYETVEKDFVSHIAELETKVLTIVTSLVINQLKEWNARPPVPSQPFRIISRHFVKLHEAIAPILPEQQVHSIYRTVHKNFKDKLREQLLKHNIVNNGGPQHGTVTSELTFYLKTLRTLRAMPETEITDDTMDDIWL